MTYIAFGCREVDVFNDGAAIAAINGGMGNNYISTTPRAPASPPSQPSGHWWDSSSWPEAADFAGVIVNRITGLWGPSTYAREATSLASRGRGRTSTLRRATKTGRIITIEGTAYGRTCCATAYGINALAQLLRSGCTCRASDAGCTCSDSSYCTCSGGGCSGDTMRVFDDRPRPASRDGVVPANSADTWYTLKNVAVVEGPQLVETDTSCSCGCRTKQRFRVVLTATDPHLYRDPVSLIDAASLTDMLSTPACGGTPNPDFWCGPLVDTPAATYIPGLPPRPSVPQPAGYVCLAPFIAQHFSTISVGTTPFDVFLNLSVTTAGSPLPAVTFTWWRKTANSAPHADYSTETACGAVTIGNIEAGHKVSIDSTCGSATLTTTATGAQRDADNRIFTVGGRPWNGSVSIGCGDWVVGVTWDAQATTTGASYSIAAVQGLP